MDFRVGFSSSIFELDFELGFRVGFRIRISSWIFELGFRVGWIFELGFRVGFSSWIFETDSKIQLEIQLENPTNSKIHPTRNPNKIIIMIIMK